MMKKILVALVTLCVLGAAGVVLFTFYGDKITALYTSRSGSQPQGKWTPPPTPVATITVKSVHLSSTVSGIGTIEATRQVDLASEVSGRIQAIEFQSGQKVQKGDVIIRLNDETEEAELVRLNVKLDLAVKKYNRARRLKRIISESKIEEAHSTLNETRAQIASINTTKSKKIILAPFDGALGIRKVNLGQYLKTGEMIVNITDLTQFDVAFKLPEKASNQIAVGQIVKVMVDALDHKIVTAKVTTIEPQIERGLHTILVLGAVINPPRNLRSGMFVEATVDINRDQQVIMVPETTVERSTFGNTVYIVKPNTDGSMIAEQITVETGRHIKGHVVITKGLRAGQIVIVSGQNRLSTGAPVIVKEPKTTVDLSVMAETTSTNHMN